MEQVSNTTFRDTVVLEQFDKDGRLVDRRETHNRIVSAGLEWVAKLIGEASPPANITHMGIGTGTTAPAAGNVALETPLGSRVAATRSYVASPSPRVMVTASFTGVTGAVTEEGLFNAASDGTMQARSTFGALNLTADDKLDVTHYIVPGV